MVQVIADIFALQGQVKKTLTLSHQFKEMIGRFSPFRKLYIIDLVATLQMAKIKSKLVYKEAIVMTEEFWYKLFDHGYIFVAVLPVVSNREKESITSVKSASSKL